ncbi:MAG: EAL domain-containing protein [Acidobacteriota bacterium]|nr:EAL domain-containing protein [Acidobacteriota bacterium]
MTDADNEKARILIIDDESLIRNILSDILGENYHCTAVGSAEEALEILRREKFQLVLSDINMGGMSGIEMIPHVHNSAPETVVMMLSAEQTVDTAIEAMRVGAFDYIRKPFDVEHVEAAVSRALEHYSLLKSKSLYENHLEELVAKRTEELNYLAYHDSLTGLPNRNLFEIRLTQAISAGRKSGQMLGILFLSLDRFKKVQDTLGYSAGYDLLKEVAERLKQSVGTGVTIARLDGDEFAVLLPQIEGAPAVEEITGKIVVAMKLPFVIASHEMFSTLSIGISLFPADGADVQTLLKNTSVALSRVREQDGDGYQFFTADMNDKAMRRLSMESSLRRALERDEFEVYYQPKLNVSSEQIVGMEALLRWRHPESGIVAPGEFIPLAEETGLIMPLGEWILRTACTQGKSWQDEGFDLHLSVNLSARQFQQKNLLETINCIIRETGFDSHCLELEVTESSIMKNTEVAIKILKELKETGIRISIDDFGTGYSSLGYLKRLPIDVLKIDKSFVQDIAADPDDTALVMTIITLAHNLRLKVVAEGVETQEQLKFLQLLMCDEWQGYLYSKPVPADAFKQLLIDGNIKNSPSLSSKQILQN